MGIKRIQRNLENIEELENTGELERKKKIVF